MKDFTTRQQRMAKQIARRKEETMLKATFYTMIVLLPIAVLLTSVLYLLEL